MTKIKDKFVFQKNWDSASDDEVASFETTDTNADIINYTSSFLGFR